MNENQKTAQCWQDALSWMQAYMKSFYSDDEDIQKAILIKEEHTKKVVNLSEKLAEHLKLDMHDEFLIKFIGLFHDIGRFKQYTLYKTFNDGKSVNHAALGLEILQEIPIMQKLSSDDCELVNFAIGNHNAKQIEAATDPRKIAFAKMIRDIDKLDIFRVLKPYLTYNDIEPCSLDFIEQFKAGGQCDYQKMRTQNDRKLVRLLWIYDLNYSWTLQQILQENYIEEIIKSLPQTNDMQQGFYILDKYIKKKAAQPDIVFS